MTIASVTVVPANASAVEGDRLQFQASVHDDQDRHIQTALVTWSSDNPSIASVDVDGVVSAHVGGSTVIRATFESVSGEAAVRVLFGPFIEVSRDSVTMSAGAGEAPPAPQVVYLTNGGTGSVEGLKASVVYPEGAIPGWLDASLGGPMAPTSITLRAKTQGRAAGVHRGRVLIVFEGAATSPVEVAVRLTLTGFEVSESGGGTSVAEASGTDTVTLVLSSQPASDVVLDVRSSDPGEATVAPGSVTFTRSNWSAPHTVTVTGVDDGADDGDQATTVTVSVNDDASDDDFDDLSDRTVSVATIDDDDPPGISITESGGSTVVSEWGTSDSFTVRLTSQPTANVRLDIRSADTGEVKASPSSLTFTRSSWNTPQTVTVAGVFDFISDGDQVVTVTVTGESTGSADEYDGVSEQVKVTNVHRGFGQ